MAAPRPANARLIGAAIALALVILVLVVARPPAVWQLIRSTEPGGLGVAAAAAGLTLVLRGLRLNLLLPAARLGPADAVVVAAAAQGAALFVPARVGELALPWLLNRRAQTDGAAGLGTLLAARALDLAGLGVWAGAGILAVWGFSQPVALLVAAALLLPALGLPFIISAVHRLAHSWFSHRGGNAQRWLDRIARLQAAVAALSERPWRTAAAVFVSLAMWGSVWLMTWWLLAAMGHRWPATTVVAGSSAASLANLLPFNLIANMGTLEAGWTAAFTALGLPMETAAATGLVAHIWALIFAAAFAAPAWLMVLLSLRRQPQL